jgi:hypothetical protein
MCVCVRACEAFSLTPLLSLPQLLFEIGDQNGCLRVCKQLIQMDPLHQRAIAILARVSHEEQKTFITQQVAPELCAKRKYKGNGSGAAMRISISTS